MISVTCMSRVSPATRTDESAARQIGGSQASPHRNCCSSFPFFLLAQPFVLCCCGFKRLVVVGRLSFALAVLFALFYRPAVVPVLASCRVSLSCPAGPKRQLYAVVDPSSVFLLLSYGLVCSVTALFASYGDFRGWR